MEDSWANRAEPPDPRDQSASDQALDFRGNRRINSVLHIASVTQARDYPPAREYLDRKRADGKTRREARRAHKRHLANRVIRRMGNDENRRLARPLQLAAQQGSV